MNKEKVKAEKDSFVDHVINVRRVTKVTKGGKRFSFSALVVSGDQHGRVGLGLGKSREVSSAIAKATNQARKSLVTIAIRGMTIPYDVKGSHGASLVEIRPASKGTGIIAGGAVRSIIESVGIKDILAKSVGSSNRQNVAKATLNALAKLRSAKQIAILRDKSVEELIGKNHVAA